MYRFCFKIFFYQEDLDVEKEDPQRHRVEIMKKKNK